MRTISEREKKMLAIIVFLSLALLINSIFMFCVIIYGANMKTENEKLKRESSDSTAVLKHFSLT